MSHISKIARSQTIHNDMNKKWAFFIAGTSAVVSLIYLSGYGYIFKAIGINLRKGPITPSIDDDDKFPFNPIPTKNPNDFEKAENYNSARISGRLIEELKKSRTSSLLVIRDNKLVYEQYWKDHNFTSAQNSFSMAKGILSMLVGCAIDDGRLTSEDQLVSTVIPKYRDSKFGKHLTFRHLMTMQSGLDWKEEYHHPFAPNSKQYFIGDLAEQALDIDLKEMPGEKYEYQSVSAQLLGLALKKAVGCDLADYLSRKIWQPLGMEFPAKWSTDDKGVEKAFCCIHATPRDFARIGQLILQNGNWEGRQIISRTYCQRMLFPTIENDAFCYSIWADDEYDVKHRFFYGFLGQFIIMIPEKNMVIVKTGLYNRLKVDKKLRPLQVRSLISEIAHII